jgi:RNA polymerase sigma factor (sigma-70 family)
VSDSATIQETLNHLFRHESGKMVSVLTRIFGTHNIDLAEDVVQDTLLKALEQWRIGGIPNNPSGWLFTVARNRALDAIRREKLRTTFAADISYLLESEYTVIPTLQDLVTEAAIEDDQLRMMFVCCHSSIAKETQIALILKTLCGFSITEIAAAFIVSPDTIEKRLYRGKQMLKDRQIGFEMPSGTQIEARLDTVLQSLYLLFNEGYNSASHDTVIREDLVEEALRLSVLLSRHPLTAVPKVFALIALMSFHAGRFPARINESGDILALKDQDRSLWIQALIANGSHYLSLSATGGEVSTYHIEAAIASVHCMAPSYQETDWQMIVELYDKLHHLTASPVAALNRAIALAELHGPAEGLKAIAAIPKLSRLEDYYLLPAAQGEFYLRSGDCANAREMFRKALTLTDSAREKSFLEKKIAECGL